MSHLVARPEAPGAQPAARPRSGSSAASSLIPTLLLGALMLSYALLFGWLSLRRYWAYDMHALDMGNMGQAAWNTIHGHPFRYTNMRLPYAIEAWRTTTRLSFHVEALFPVISLVYLLYPHPESLLLLQTVALTLGAVPVFLLAREVLKSAWLALVFVLAYLLFPTLEGLNLYEFHPVSLATPLLLFAFLFAWRRQYIPFVLCCLAAMGTKEEIGLVVAMFGLYVAVVNCDRRVGLGTAAVGIGWSLFAVLVVEHHFRQPGTITYFHTRYGYLGHGVRGAIHTVVHDPLVVARVVFTWPKLGYVLRLLAPVGFTALLAPVVLVLGAPTFLINVLSTDYHMYSGLGDNSAELISVVVAAGILGSSKLLAALRRSVSARRAEAVVGAVVLLSALVNQHLTGFVPLLSSYGAPAITKHDHLADRFVAMVPPSAPISTQDQLDPHLSSRRYLYLLEDTGRIPPLVPANYILLDVSAPTYPLPSYQLHDRAMSWLRRSGWGVAAAVDGLILIERGAAQRGIPPQFYTYAQADGASIPHRLAGHDHGLQVLGYGLDRTDQPNYRVPNLNYRFYLRPTSPIRQTVQPIVYETVGTRLVGCADNPLGLAWFPTTAWKAGHTYVVRMDPLETSWQTPGIAHLYAEFRSLSTPPADCSRVWRHHGKLYSIGSISIGL